MFNLSQTANRLLRPSSLAGTVTGVSVLAMVLTAAGCVNSPRQTQAQQEPARRYSRTAPTEQELPDFERIFHAVRLITSTAYYRQADFSEPLGLREGRQAGDLWSRADSISTFTETLSGTATLVQFTDDRLAAVTAAHVVSYPDTVRSYYFDGDKRSGIKAIAVLVRLDILIPDLDGARQLKILARDDERDIVIIGQTVETKGWPELSSSQIPIGRAVDLAWGSHAFVAGFPVGNKMVTSGLVSEPDRNRDHGFLLDVVFNRGMSGAPILARRTGTDRFEWVGIVTSGSAGSEYLLVPDEDDAERAIEKGEPFDGEVFASHFLRIRYGVTIAVSIESIRNLIQSNRALLQREQYAPTLDYFTNRPQSSPVDG